MGQTVVLERTDKLRVIREDGEEIELQIDAMQRSMLEALNQSWIETKQLREEVLKIRKELTETTKRLDAHDRYGDYCPHTGR